VLVGKLRDFLTLNPSHAVTDANKPELDVTGAMATARTGE